MTIEEMRLNYAQASLSIQDVDSDPLVQFDRWFQEAIKSELPEWFEANAMTLSTTDGSGHCTSRIVLLKAVEDGKFVFFTNYESTKGTQISACPNVSLCFFWPHLQRQVRIEGQVSKTSRQRSAEYFRNRPLDSQLGAHVSQQSAEIESRAVMQKQMEQLRSKYGDGPVPCPDNWGGYAVLPTQIEFWQGRPSRLHDRIVYRRDQDAWKTVRLSP